MIQYHNTGLINSVPGDVDFPRRYDTCILAAVPGIYKISLRDGVDLISRGRRKLKRGNTGVPMIRMGCCSFFCCCVLRIPGVRSDDVCLIAGLEVKMLSWFDLLLLCTNHMHIHRDWHEGESLEHRCRCTTAAVLYAY